MFDWFWAINRKTSMDFFACELHHSQTKLGFVSVFFEIVFLEKIKNEQNTSFLISFFLCIQAFAMKQWNNVFFVWYAMNTFVSICWSNKNWSVHWKFSDRFGFGFIWLSAYAYIFCCWYVGILFCLKIIGFLDL